MALKSPNRMRTPCGFLPERKYGHNLHACTENYLSTKRILVFLAADTRHPFSKNP